MLVSNFEVYITIDGNGAIKFYENNRKKIVIIPKNNLIPKEIFDLYYNQLSTFKNRHYAIAKWIVNDIRRMGYVFKEKKLNSAVFLPIKAPIYINEEYSNFSKEEKMKLLWLELDMISKKFEMIH